MNETSGFYFHPPHSILIQDYLILKIRNRPIPRLARDYFQNLGDVRSLDKNITRILRTYPIPQPQKCDRLYFDKCQNIHILALNLHLLIS
jgi:hypothetical protein